MSEAEQLDLGCLEDSVGHRFKDRSLLESALTHASALPGGVVRVSEQLEFLGDAVLNLAIADLLLRVFPAADEGQLSKLRAMLVQTATLAAKGRELGLGGALRLGRGEHRSGGREKPSILAAAYESVLGAIFRDAGFERAKAVVARHFVHELTDGFLLATQDWKTMLQERIQARLRTVPEYRVVEERGPAHAREFAVEVWVAGECLARGEGPNKREAEQQAARSALSRVIEREIAE